MTSPETDSATGLRGLRVLAFESRRAAEMAELIRRHGGEPVMAPAMREVAVTENGPVLEFLRRLEASEIDIVIVLTGVGLRTLVDTVAAQWPRARVAAALGRVQLVARGPKAAAALRELGLLPHVTVPEPNTWREILAALDADVPLAGQRVAVQEYGIPNPELLAGLETRGATVFRVPVYRWALPEDIAPLRAAVNALHQDRVDMVLFTSATQVYHLFEVAAGEGGAEALRAALRRVVVASIGPVCSEALRAHGLSLDIEPEHAKMGQLVAAAARRGRALRAAKLVP